MSWQPPELEHLVESRIRRARLELADDARIADALAGKGEDSPAFLAQLIEEKIGAAARTGLDAVEATLRLEATEHLLVRGLHIQAVRACVAEAAAPFASPSKPSRGAFADWPIPPLAIGAMVFGAWTLAALGWWAAVPFPIVYLVLGIGAGIAPAWLAKAIAEKHVAAARKALAHEYPPQVCRHYMQVYRDCVAAYGQAVGAGAADAPEPFAAPATQREASSG